jgi:Icc-related predicted phosphoesterase
VADLTIFYVADIHGSDTCFRKWLNAAGFYGADVLIVGGDLTGKVLVPIYPAAGPVERWTATWRDRRHDLETRREVEAFIARARETGAYGFVTTAEEVADIQGSIERERSVFTRLKVTALESWMRLADERLAGRSVRALVMAGNDDPPEIDAVLGASSCLEDVQGRSVELAPGVTMASRGESTPTPWRTPRELSEDELGDRIRETVDALPAAGTTIWNLHMPPANTGIDRAPVLDADLRVRYDGSGEPVLAAVGSMSVRALIEERQPTIALHGHIHEGRGRYKLGRTSGFNPGSQYQDGVLQGVLLRVSPKHGLRDLVFTAG